MSKAAPPADEAAARDMDERDPLRRCRDLFHIPPSPAHADGRESISLGGNSLGLMPKLARERLGTHLDDWARLGVEGHFHAQEPWYPYHEFLRDSSARLVGALPHEVVCMNSLTVNLHLLMLSFYRPTADRFRILIDGPCFPSDVYAVKSQLRLHGHDPNEALRWIRPRDGEHSIRTEDVEAMLHRDGKSIALVLFAAVNYYSGHFYDVARITRAAHAAGCLIGWDLAHAAGNVPLRLHDWDADFAAWCTYKYLNSGPGAVAGAFVHERWTRGQPADTYRAMPRLEGWWGNDPATRFRMTPEFEPVASADAWSLSNPPIFSLAPVKASLELFDEAGMPALREKSIRLTAYLESLVEAIPGQHFRIITPRDPEARGCQLSLLTRERGRDIFDRLQKAGVLCDFREPNVIRVAPVPLYNTFADCFRFAEALASAVG